MHSRFILRRRHINSFIRDGFHAVPLISAQTERVAGDDNPYKVVLINIAV